MVVDRIWEEARVCFEADDGSLPSVEVCLQLWRIVMSTVSIEEVQNDLSSILDRLEVGEELLIVRNAVPLGKLTRLEGGKPKRVLGRGEGRGTIIAEDEEHLEHFKDYMP